MKPKNMALAVGLIVFALVSMFPPWAIWDKDDVLFKGFSFIASPPLEGIYQARIYFQMLAVEWSVIAAVTGAAWLCCGYKRTPGHGNN